MDRSGEIFDYAKSKPNFIRWSEGLGKATDGKNIGNVRAMHGNVSAGITKELHFDDSAKAITVKAEITDDNEWRKVLKGNYTGLSIGGKYAEKWTDDAVGKTRYAADPTEYSLVDLPCNPEATFSVVKANGAEELHKFEHTTDDLAKWADDLTDAETDAVMAKIARRKGVDPKEGEDKYGKNADFADAKNKKYPLDTAEHVRAAWSYIHMPKNAAKYDAADLKTIRARIIAAWKEKIDSNGPPAAEKYALASLQKMAASDEAQALAKAARALLGESELEKGLYTVAVFAQLLEQLAAITDGTVLETKAEGDDSTLPAVMAAALKPIAAAFLAMAEEETNEALHGQLNDDASMELSAKGDLAKVGRKHTKKTREHHAAIRDHLAKANEHLDALQADDPKAEDDDKEGADKMAKAADEIAKRDDLLTKAAARIDELTQAVAVLQAQPQPVKAALRIVSKGQDIGDPTAPEREIVKKSDGSVDEVATALRHALSNPVRVR